MNINKISLFINTIRYLKFKQLYFFFIRRMLKPKRVIVHSEINVRNDIVLNVSISVFGIYLSGTIFNFLNYKVDLKGEKFNWNPQLVKRLWSYNLHYFDYLREDARPIENKKYLIDDWIKNNSQLSRPGWEPFTASLRIVNWIKFFIECKDSGNYPLLNENTSLYEQALWLEKNDESHILANHYFENLKALCFAGVYFQGDDADRWLKKAKKELILQLKEQQLDDGGHYERTPQYHCLMLENYLDLFNLANNNKFLFDDGFVNLLQKTCDASLRFLSDIVFPTNSIPLFNDSAFGIAPTFLELSDYASALYNYKPIKNDNHLICKPDSGIYGVKYTNDMLIIDCGDVGPTYQPGHTHCDFLSYELMLDGQMLIVDTGVYEYEPGETRIYERSTEAHNTISVDDDEQSEIWGEFRVGRRANKLYAEIQNISRNVVGFKGAYRGFFNVKGKIEHHREVVVTSSMGNSQITKIQFNDTVKGSENHSIKSFIHLHPDVVVEQLSSFKFVLERSQYHKVELDIFGDVECSLTESEYYPEFSLKLVNKRITLMYDGLLPAKLGYSLTRIN